MKVRMLTVCAQTANGKEVPALRLSGDWLAKIGFRSGKKVIISERPGELLVQLVSVACDERSGYEGVGSCE